MITRNFIEKIHVYFDELNYRPNGYFNMNEYLDALTKTITHCESLEDLKRVCILARYIDKKSSKIARMFEKKKKIYDEYRYEGSEFISRVSDDETIGHFYLTNGLTRKQNRIFLAGYFEDGEHLYEMNYSNNRFFFENNSYSMKFKTLNIHQMNLYDKGNQYIGTVALKDDHIAIKENKTPFEVIKVGKEIYVFRQKDIGSGNKKLNLDKAIALIEWDALSDNGFYGVSRFFLFDELKANEFELICLLATVPFLLFAREMEYQMVRTISLGATLGSMAARRNQRR